MPWPQLPLPPELAGGAFHVQEALAAGLSASALRHPRLLRPYHGVRVPHPESTVRPPIRKDPEAYDDSAFLGPATTERFSPWVRSDGARIVPPGLAFVQAAGILTFRELVVAADHLIRPRRKPDRPPIAALEVLQAAVEAASTRGIRRARAALSFARVGAESRLETLLRLLLASYGLDHHFQLQVDVFDRQGRWIGRFDLVDLERRLIVEYDGEHHRTSTSQYERDGDRLEEAADAGYKVIRVRKRQLFAEPMRTLHRISEALGEPLRPVTGSAARWCAE